MVSYQVRPLWPRHVLASRAKLVQRDESLCLCLCQKIRSDYFAVFGYVIRVKKTFRIAFSRDGVVLPVEVVEGVLEDERAVLLRRLYGSRHVQQRRPIVGQNVLVDVNHEDKLEIVDEPQIALVQRCKHSLSPNLLLRL